MSDARFQFRLLRSTSLATCPIEKRSGMVLSNGEGRLRGYNRLPVFCLLLTGTARSPACTVPDSAYPRAIVGRGE